MINAQISIVTITYNDLNGLKKTIQSIDANYKLSNKYIDHVIIDGNSTDGTSDYIKIIKKSRKIATTLISEADLGIYDAMNKGVSNSSSEFVIFINSGDLILSTLFEETVYDRLLEILYNSKSAGLALDCIYNFVNRKYIVKAREINILTPKMPSLHQGIIYKRSVLLEIPYSLNYKICGDWENISKILKKYKFEVLNINVSELVAGGVSTTKPVLLLKESYDVFRNNFSPNIYNKIKYISKIFFSLIIVQLLFLKSNIKFKSFIKF